MAYQGTARSMEAAQRRQQRDAEKRRRDLERRAKQQAKLSEVEKARCEVEIHENQIELLLSVHKEQGPVWDWTSVAVALPPPVPQKTSYNEYRARQQACLAPPDEQQASTAKIAQARSLDDQIYQQALQTHAPETADVEKLRSLAQRILAGEAKAYTDALVELSPLAELSALGSNIHFTVHSSEVLECLLKVNATQAIPAEVKTLTATEKLSVKPMPKARFHELYQDHICGCILRVAREVFSLLPISTLLITATADGITEETPVLSAAITRASLAPLDFDNLDPSDTLETFPHRGDFKASRKGGAFAPIVPLTTADIPGNADKHLDAPSLLAQAEALRKQICAEISSLTPTTDALS